MRLNDFGQAPLFEHCLVSAALVLSRVALLVAGVEFNFALDWMFLSDPSHLENDLVRSIVVFHAYPPGMNLLTGLVLKVSTAHAAAIAHLVFVGFGALLVNSLLALLRYSGIGTAARVLASVAFCLTPAALFFENLYLYETPVAALLCFSAVLFYRALEVSSTQRWAAFFLACAAIGWIRSTFHLVWFATMLAAAFFMTMSGRRKYAVLGALGPAVVILAVYVKNGVQFGVFGAASSGASNLAHVTVLQLPRAERAEWIRNGKLSRFSGMSVYASPKVYLPFFPDIASGGPPQLDSVNRRSLNAPNYNHRVFLEVGPRRASDALYYVRHRPLDYLRTVGASLAQIFGPSTIWHPRDREGLSARSPHAQHRTVLGGYERFYNRLFHTVPLSPWGVYLFLPAFLVPCFRMALKLRNPVGSSERARSGLMFFCVFQVLYVVALSAVFTIGESSRYRFQIESLIWVIVAFGVLSAVRALWPIGIRGAGT